jgi:hypothetical protein
MRAQFPVTRSPGLSCFLFVNFASYRATSIEPCSLRSSFGKFGISALAVIIRGMSSNEPHFWMLVKSGRFVAPGIFFSSCSRHIFPLWHFRSDLIRPALPRLSGGLPGWRHPPDM